MATRARLAALVLVTGVGLGACVRVTAPPPLPTRACITSAPAKAAEYQKLFDLRSTEAMAADIWDPTTIGTRTVWFLGDTFVGRQKPAGVPVPGYSFVHNAIQSQTGRCLDTIMAGREGARADLFPRSQAGYFWPAGTFVDGGNIKVMLLLVRPFDRPGTGFDFYVAGIRMATVASDMRVLSIQDPAPLADAANPDSPLIIYGNFVSRDDTYVYLYGTDGDFNDYVARTTTADVLTTWEYWDGTGWSNDPAAATPMQFNGAAPWSQLRVVRYGDGWLGISKDVDGFSDDVTAWYSSSPVGPWTKVPTPAGDGRIGYTPVPDDDLAYGAAIVNLPGAGWTVIWNVQGPITSDVHRYGLKFAAPSNLPAPETLFPPPP